MRKRLLTTLIFLLAAILVVFGILMPRIAFSYQNDTLLTQVEKDQIDEVSFSSFSQNEAFNALQMIASGESTVLSDTRDSDVDTRRQLKMEATTFLNLIQSYKQEYYDNYGYANRSLAIISSSTHCFALRPCTISINNSGNDASSILYDFNTLTYDSSYSTASSSGDPELTGVWNSRDAWLITTNELLDSQDITFLIDDTSRKIVFFSIYEDDIIETTSFSQVDANQCIYVFTKLFEDYYGATVLSSQSEYDNYYYDYYYDNDNDTEYFDEFRLYFTISDSATSDNSIGITIFISSNYICFNEIY